MVEKVLRYRLAVLIQYRFVTDRHPASQPRCLAVVYTALCYASRG